MVDFDTYHRRINAMNFALTHDDAIAVNYDDADVILWRCRARQDGRPAFTWPCITGTRPTTR